MKVQMVVMANAREARGRSLVGILLDGGQPVFRSDGRPHWLRPVLRRDKPSIPVPMIVDLVPQDIIEFDLVGGSSVHEAGGWLQMDPYSLKIKGRMSLEAVQSCCWVAGAGALEELAEEDILSPELSLILACRCTVIAHVVEQEGQRQTPELKFGFNGIQFQFPLADPLFLDALMVTPDVLVDKNSVQIVLSPFNAGSPVDRNRRVLAVLV